MLSKILKTSAEPSEPYSGISALSGPHMAVIRENGSDRSEGSENTAEKDPCREVILRLVALPGVAGEPPPQIRLRRLLKLALRGFGFRAEWTPSPIETNPNAGDAGKESL